MKQHPTAVVDPAAEIGANVEVGPHAYVGPHVRIGDDCVLAHGAHIEGHVTLGRGNTIGPFAVLGSPPQDYKFGGEPTKLVIGDDNTFREHVTVNIGTPTGMGITRIGNRNFLMIASHVGHDCLIEDDVLLVNTVLLAGHCHVQSGAKLYGAAAVNQFCTIGRQAFVGGLTRIVHDVPPFLIIEGNPARIRGVNEVGLQRAGFEQPCIAELWEAYKAIYRTRELNRLPIYDMIEGKPGVRPETVELVQFLRRAQKGPHGRYRQSGQSHPLACAEAGAAEGETE